MSVFSICERSLGLVRGNRLDLTPGWRSMLESLDYEGLVQAQAQEEAITCVRHFAYVRDKLLQQHAWVFARKVSPMAQVTTPLNGWAYGYVLPADCLKVLSIVVSGETLREFEIAGRTVGCHAEKAQIRYTARVTDTNSWDPLFTDVFCSMLAAEGAVSVMGQPQLLQLMEQRAADGVRAAYENGAISHAGELKVQRHDWRRYS